MSEVTLTDDQFGRALRILWNYEQFRSETPPRDGNHEMPSQYVLACDDDDLHEYLTEAGLLVQDHDANTDEDPNAFQWLSNDSMERLRRVRVRPRFMYT